jgi:hypothetical protein
MLVLALLGALAATTGARAAEPAPAPNAVAPGPSVPHEMSKPIIVARSCASECQAQHDRCRVVTKGSRTCDEERQRCLEICLQKKKK